MTFFYRWLPVLVLLFLFLASEASAQSATPPSASVLRAQIRQLNPMQLDEVLWLARCVYSESDRTHEQRLVAWVVRNRVETHYRGTTYRDVVLEPRQFSAFNTPSVRRSHILGLNQHSLSSAWRKALGVALEVYQAPASKRPFKTTTRHFYSPVSMVGDRTPHWAVDATPLSSARLGVDANRFQFFTDIDETTDTPVIAASETETAPALAASSPVASKVAKRRTSLRNRLRARTFSGHVKRPVRPARRTGN